MGHESGIDIIKPLSSSYLGQTFRGVVRNSTDDPEQRGRCKIEVLPVFKGITEADLPWAIPKWSLNRTQIPAEGETVWVFFEEGDVFKPVYMNGSVPIELIDGVNTLETENASKNEGDPHIHAQTSLGDTQYHESRAVQIQEREDANKVPISGNDTKSHPKPQDEPDMRREGTYPYIDIEITPGLINDNGMMIEHDDTPSKHRYHMYHSSDTGSFIEIDKDGNHHIRVDKAFAMYIRDSSRMYVLVDQDTDIMGNETHDVWANRTVNVHSGNETYNIDQNRTVNVCQDLLHDVEGKWDALINQEIVIKSETSSIKIEATGIVDIDGSTIFLN